MSASCPHILQPVASLNPRTFYKNTILEYISNTRNNLCAVNCRKVCAEVIVIAGFGVCLPSGIQNSEFCIIILTCSLIRENSGILAFFYAVNISVVETIVFKTCAVVKNTIIIKFAVNNAACKNAVNVKFAVYNAVCLFVAEQAFAVNKVVSRCGNGRAPINNRLADFAVSSSSVPLFRAGRRLVRKSNGINVIGRGRGIILLRLRSVVMSAVPCRIVGGFGFVCPIVSFGIHLNLSTGKGVTGSVNKCYLAANDGSADVNGPNFIAFSVFGIHPNVITRSVRNYCGKFPGSHGHGNEHSLSRRIVFTGAGNGNGRDVLVRVGNNVRSGEALRDFHVVEFPFAYVVKVNICADGLNLFDIRRNKVYIINRAEEDIVESCVMCNKFDGRLAGVGGDINLAYNRIVVALLVANREFNGVNSVRENAVRNGHNAALDRAGNLNAVHIRFCGGFVKSCCIVFYQICNHRAERNIVIGRFGNFSSDERNRITHTGRCPTNITEHRSVSVIYRGRIINCYIVKIHNNIDVL